MNVNVLPVSFSPVALGLCGVDNSVRRPLPPCARGGSVGDECLTAVVLLGIKGGGGLKVIAVAPFTFRADSRAERLLPLARRNWAQRLHHPRLLVTLKNDVRRKYGKHGRLQVRLQLSNCFLYDVVSDCDRSGG
ncbi:hypothetical protein, conserved [Leishmania tarentolae]|uniref:Uncharacterized protein n=1 Tax=Leishmania tarentolae TaxID=5689 RepID=A0A640KR54_LEITA|nr:hypothetical protein, conserved [Leishmania tarentolae]